MVRKADYQEVFRHQVITSKHSIQLPARKISRTKHPSQPLPRTPESANPPIVNARLAVTGRVWNTQRGAWRGLFLSVLRGKPRHSGRGWIARAAGPSGLMGGLLLLDVLPNDFNRRTATAPSEIARSLSSKMSHFQHCVCVSSCFFLMVGFVRIEGYRFWPVPIANVA